MIKKPEPGDNNATMQLDAVGDMEGVQLDDSEAEDAPGSVPPPSVGRAAPPPLPAFAAQPPGSRPSAPPPPAGPRRAAVYGAIAVMVVVGITGGLMLGSALRGKPAVTAAPSAAPSGAPPGAAASAPSSTPTVMRLDTIEVVDPPAETK